MNIKRILLIIAVLIMTFALVYTPHFNNPFPIHIDEWHHITEAIKLKSGEYSGGGIGYRFGFHFLLMILSYFVNLIEIYKFLPAIWVVISSLVLFYVVYRKTESFYLSLLSMFFFASLKSNVNILGLWFFTPLIFSIPFIFLYIYFFTEGFEKQNKKNILISFFIMLLLIPIYSISVLFAVPFLIIYSLFYFSYIRKEWKFFSIFLAIPVLGLLLFSYFTYVSLIFAIPKLINSLQFKYGWGVLELKNSPFELYSLLGYILAGLGIVFIFLREKNRKKYLVYILWPIILFLSIVFYRLFDVSYLCPYQRNLYFFAISLPFLSAFGLYSLIKLLNLEKYRKVTKIIIIAIIILGVFIFSFKGYFDIPRQVAPYKLIDNNDYKALSYLSFLPEGNVLANPGISTTIYPIAKKGIITSIFFYGKERRSEVENFFKSKNCTKQKELIKKYNVTYILTKQKINCNWEVIYNKGDIIYKVK